jgi:hypothetical protein
MKTFIDNKSLIHNNFIKKERNSISNNKNNSKKLGKLNKMKTLIDVKDIQEEAELNIFDLIKKTVFCNNIEKYFEVKYFQSKNLSVSPEFVFASSLYSFIKLSAIVYKNEKAINLFEYYSEYKEIEIHKFINDMINKNIFSREPSNFQYYQKMILNSENEVEMNLKEDLRTLKGSSYMN